VARAGQKNQSGVKSSVGTLYWSEFKYSQYPKISTSKFETIESEAGFPQALELTGPGKLA